MTVETEKPADPVVEYKEDHDSSDSNEELRQNEDDGHVTWKTILAVLVSSSKRIAL